MAIIFVENQTPCKKCVKNNDFALNVHFSLDNWLKLYLQKKKHRFSFEPWQKDMYQLDSKSFSLSAKLFFLCCEFLMVILSAIGPYNLTLYGYVTWRHRQFFLYNQRMPICKVHTKFNQEQLFTFFNEFYSQEDTLTNNLLHSWFVGLLCNNFMLQVPFWNG